MTVSDYIFNFIEQKGCRKVYMVSGSSAMWLTDALYRNKMLLAICCHHEQVAAMAADGYGRVNNVPGTCLITIGPGATNAITGVAQAYLDSSPMIVISGQTNSQLLKYASETGIRQKGCQSINLEPIVTSITKFFSVVMNPDEIPQIMEEAYYMAMEGRKGPVWIDVPIDIQNKEVSVESIEVAVPRDFQSASVNDNVISKIAGWLTTSKKPLILAGYGVRSSGAVSLLSKIVELYDIPVVTSRGGIDAIDSNSPYFIGRPGNYGDRSSHFAIQEADLILILGSRLSVSTIGYYPDRFGKNAKKVMVDIDTKELEKDDVYIDCKVFADVKTFLNLLSNKIKGVNLQHMEWVAHCQRNKAKYPTVLDEYKEKKPLNEYYITSIISELTKEDANIVVDTGSVCNIVSQSWKIKKNQRYLISGGLSCMGFWATALGAYQKGKELIAIAGDGSVQMNIQELATIKYNKIPIKLFVYNNNGYMLIRHNQHSYMNDRFLGVGPDSGLSTPNFYKIAKAYDINAVRLEAEDDIFAKVKEIIEAKEPVLCEIICQEFAPIIPKIASRVMPDGSLKAAEFEDLYPFLD